MAPSVAARGETNIYGRDEFSLASSFLFDVRAGTLETTVKTMAKVDGQ